MLNFSPRNLKATDLNIDHDPDLAEDAELD